MAISPGSTLVDYLVPSKASRSLNLLRDALLVVGFSALIALCARLHIDLPFTPVPITLQPLAVVLAGAALGSRRGALAMLLYLAEGASGLPVFARGGGPLYLVGPTAGYLWSYPIAAFVVGLLCERGLDRNFLTSVLAMLPGSLIIYAVGVPWLAVTTHIDLYHAFLAGMVPFFVGDLIKLLVAAALLPTAWAIVRAVKPPK
ncbi:MAG: biotin transporter BioY [Chloroflexi bacterium]|nr:biotin transporter BioY [Chloroflexota bacterium]